MQAFPHDSATYGIDSQFMLGDALMGIPIMTEGADDVTGYLPNGDWFNYFTYTRLTSYNASSTVGQNFSFCSALDDTAHVPLILRGGNTVFTQTPMLTTAETVKQPLSMQVALDWRGESVGHLSLDDGLTIGNIQAHQYNAFEVTTRMSVDGTGSMTGHIQYRAQHLAPQYDISHLYVQRIAVLGGDLADGTSVSTPKLTVNGKETQPAGVKVSVMNGAIVLEDSSASLLPAGQNWELSWPTASQEQQPVVVVAQKVDTATE